MKARSARLGDLALVRPRLSEGSPPTSGRVRSAAVASALLVSDGAPRPLQALPNNPTDPRVALERYAEAEATRLGLPMVSAEIVSKNLHLLIAGAVRDARPTGGRLEVPALAVLEAPVSAVASASTARVDGRPWDAERIRNSLSVVHVTNVLPVDGVLQPGALANRDGSVRASEYCSFRPTIHFSIGQMVQPFAGNSSENRRYGIVMPLGRVLPQALSLSPADTVILGELRLPRDATVVVPVAEMFVPPPGVRVHRYDPLTTTLREAIDTVIDGANTEAAEQRGSLALLRDGIDLNSRAFFEPVLKGRPGLRFGQSANHPVVAVDRAAIALQGSFEEGRYPHPRVFRVTRLMIEELIAQQDLQGLPEAARVAFAEKRALLDKQLYAMTQDIVRAAPPRPISSVNAMEIFQAWSELEPVLSPAKMDRYLDLLGPELSPEVRSVTKVRAAINYAIGCDPGQIDAALLEEIRAGLAKLPAWSPSLVEDLILQLAPGNDARAQSTMLVLSLPELRRHIEAPIIARFLREKAAPTMARLAQATPPKDIDELIGTTQALVAALKDLHQVGLHGAGLAAPTHPAHGAIIAHDEGRGLIRCDPAVTTPVHIGDQVYLPPSPAALERLLERFSSCLFLLSSALPADPKRTAAAQNLIAWACLELWMMQPFYDANRRAAQELARSLAAAMGLASPVFPLGSGLDGCCVRYLNQTLAEIGLLSADAKPVGVVDGAPTYAYAPASLGSYFDALESGLAARLTQPRLSEICADPAITAFADSVFRRSS